MDARPRRRLLTPWADIILFIFVGGVIAFWWFKAPGNGNGQTVAQVTAAQLPAVQTSAASRSQVTPTATRMLTTPTMASLPTLTVSPSPSATLTPLPTSTPVPTPVRHKVSSGESLSIIADKYGATAKDIADANELTLNAMLHPGDELVVPVAGAKGGAGPTPTPAGGTLLYSVQPGDTISEIAERFDSRIDWILAASKRKETDILRPGDQLQIPLSDRTPTPTATPGPTATPTVAPTSELYLRTPILLSPADKASVAGEDEVFLRWASSVVLAKDQWYVVSVKVEGSTTPVAPYWTKGTAWRLPLDIRPAERETSLVTWQVQVFAGPQGSLTQGVQPGQRGALFHLGEVASRQALAKHAIQIQIALFSIRVECFHLRQAGVFGQPAQGGFVDGAAVAAPSRTVRAFACGFPPRQQVVAGLDLARVDLHF